MAEPKSAKTEREISRDRLADSARSLDLGLAFGLVHVPGLPADECLVRFAGSAQLCERIVLHCQANAMDHMPRALLRDADGAVLAHVD